MSFIYHLSKSFPSVLPETQRKHFNFHRRQKRCKRLQEMSNLYLKTGSQSRILTGFTVKCSSWKNKTQNGIFLGLPISNINVYLLEWPVNFRGRRISKCCRKYLCYIKNSTLWAFALMVVGLLKWSLLDARQPHILDESAAAAGSPIKSHSCDVHKKQHTS